MGRFLFVNIDIFYFHQNFLSLRIRLQYHLSLLKFSYMRIGIIFLRKLKILIIKNPQVSYLTHGVYSSIYFFARFCPYRPYTFEVAQEFSRFRLLGLSFLGRLLAFLVELLQCYLGYEQSKFHSLPLV